MEVMKMIKISVIAVYVLYIENVIPECRLHMCLNCTVICHTATVTPLVEEVSENTCIEKLNNSTVMAVEYHRLTKKCQLSSHRCVTYAKRSEGTSIAYTYRCSEGCSEYLLTAIERMAVRNQPSYSFSSMPDLCVDTSIGSNKYVFDVYSYQSELLKVACHWFADCEADYSCTYSPTIEDVVTVTRTCVTPCDLPAAPMYGEVLYPPQRTLVLGDIATFTCRAEYFLLGSNTSECQINGSWSTGAPKCLNTAGGVVEPKLILSSVMTSPITPLSATSATFISSSTVTTTPSDSASSSSLSTLSSINSPTISPVAVPTSPSSETKNIMTSSFQTSVTSSVTSSYKPIFIYPCPCNNFNHGNETVEDLVAIDHKQTSAAKNKLICKPDPRPSARIIGLTGGVILTSCAFVLITCDIFTFVCRRVKTKKK